MTIGSVQHDLLAVARREFVERGYGGASIRSIAQKTGVSLSAMYYHYSSKQELLAAMLNAGMDSFEGRVAEEFEAKDSTPTGRLLGYVASLVRFRTLEQEQSQLVQTETRNLEPQHLAAYRERQRRSSEPLRRAVADGVESGEFRTPYPEDSYRSILGMCNAIAHWYEPDGDLAVEEIVRRYQEIALRVVYHRDADAPTS
ncbi:TetR/AcrR family transcriptional regulator [Rhodococcus sp. IEGM 1408]|uniref:TetR/AcrR family transcriptional regulator n=1 Tax=Rhodococcus sp. IEGM 1408 TaxID=3082220 RepID=UPI0029549DE9|nr:TetR/AcrR family transcriptional regulator [Rhodococcus sp. IEGM 1408]MDV8001361.1 TetR/AcrR family transcriptional regulator [Rhodococcus sp. IEGM 1408]